MSNDYGQVPFAEKFDFAEDLVANPQPRVPVVLLLDTSGSMQGSPIAQLNAGLVAFKEELMGDSLASKRAENGFPTALQPRIAKKNTSNDKKCAVGSVSRRPTSPRSAGLQTGAPNEGSSSLG